MDPGTLLWFIKDVGYARVDCPRNQLALEYGTVAAEFLVYGNNPVEENWYMYSSVHL